MKELAVLQEIGLTKGEIKVYCSLLELGSSTTGVIVKSAKVSRSKVYEMLDHLIDKGMVSFIVKENRKYFEAATPQTILRFVAKKKEELIEKETALKKMLPLLEEKQKFYKKPQSATVYEGVKGIKTMFNELLSPLKKGDEYYAISVEPEIFQNAEFKIFIKNYHLRRAEKKVRVKLLAPRDLKQAVSDSIGQTRYVQIKYITQAIPTATLIYSDKIATFTWSGTPVGVVIRSENIAERYRNYFYSVWKTAKL